MKEFLHNCDINIFHFINMEFTHPWADVFFQNITDLHKQPAAIAIALAVFAFFGSQKFGWYSIRVLLALSLAIALGDMFAYRVLKANIERPRPFQTQEFMGKSRTLTF